METFENKGRKRGRPVGACRQYEAAKVRVSHFMTPAAHAWIRSNKALIEENASNLPKPEKQP